ncbi:hypothetical protein EDF22_0604 [Rathayibacter sp. PhB127]|uniref:hypothetical protein n=1 Tax=Rathayibacter sp. PhB127 TaxID=2485176 RepID=UPI000F4CC743|nr:hypothetical protein [Rathayibacter sp. PhB127]ROS28873.1 hypothetical protein EDF22_0604 [Rathayibacter sp. PhB127]
MSAVDVPRAFSAADAERLSSRIGLKLDSMADTFAGVLPLIREAIERDVYALLGYASHGAYVSDRFGDSLAKLGVDMRREVVRELTEAGLSQRAIAPVFGVSQPMIAKDVRAIEASEVITRLSPADEPAFDPTPTLPPSQYDWVEPGAPDFDPTTGEVIVDVEPEPEPVRVVTGLDGKSYPQQAPTEPRRRSLVDDAYTASRDLWKVLERIRSITSDDRFNRNKADIRAALQPGVDLAREVFADLGIEPNER